MAPSYVYSSGSGELVVAVVPESYSWLWFRLPWKPPNVFLAVDVVVTGTVVVAVVVIDVIVDSIVLLVSVVVVVVVVAVAIDAIVADTDVVAIVAAVAIVVMLVVVDEATSMVLSTSEWLFSISLSLSLYNLKNKHNIIKRWLFS